MRAHRLSLALLLAGCAPTGPARRSPSVLPAPRAADFLDPAVTGAALRTRYLERARVIRAGGRYASRHSAAEAATAHRLLWPVVVLEDAGAGAQPARVRLLCEHGDYRLAVWADRGDLATVARAPVHLTASPPAPARLGAAAPGLYLSAGYLLDSVKDADGSTLRAAVHGLFFRGELLIPKERVGVTYREAPAPLPATSRLDGEVPRSAAFLDAPGGALVAAVARPDGTANTLYITRLQDRGDGWALVRYDDGDASVVGWVTAAEIRWLDTPIEGGSLTGYGVGGGGGSGRSITLGPGTLLRAEPGGEPLGVVLRSADFPLATDANESAPVLSLAACGGRVRVQPDGRKP